VKHQVCSASVFEPCTGLIFVSYPAPLCQTHAMEIALQVTDRLFAAARQGAGDAATSLDAVTVQPEEIWRQTTHEPVVYFLGNGNRIKIGTTRSLQARVSTLALRRSNILLLLSGGRGLEGTLHAAFGRHRLGTSEWFVADPEIHAFVSARRVPLRGPTVPAQPTNEEPRRVVDPRARVVYQLVEQAGPSGLNREEIRAAFANHHPDEKPPHVDVIGRWLKADPRIHQPRYGRYATKAGE
jgi:hypothetical protein